MFTPNIFGILDVLVAILLLIGEIPGPDLLIKIIIAVLIFKAFISVVTIPFEIPGLVLLFGVVDVLAAILLFSGVIPGPNILKLALAIIILIKGVVSIATPVIKLIG